MTHRDHMLALFAQLKAADLAPGVLRLRVTPIEPAKVKDPAAVLLARFNQEERLLRKLYRRRYGAAAERLDPRLRIWQNPHG